MAARRAVAATDIPGNAEVVDHERTGLLFAPRNPAALAAAVLRLLREPHLAETCAYNARRLIETRFAPGIMARRTEDVYRRLLALRRR